MGSVVLRVEQTMKPVQQITDILRIGWLDEVQVDLSLGRAALVFFAAIAGDGDKHRPSPPVKLAQPFRQLPAVHAGKTDVQKHDLEISRLGSLQRRRGVGHCLHIMSEAPQPPGHTRGRIGVVLNY